MVNTKLSQSIQRIVSTYKAMLTSINEEEFQRTPPIGGWSYSEVYAHIFDSSLLSLLAVQKCLNGDGIKEKTHFSARVILFFGMLPPGKRYKVPKKLMDRAKKINLTAAQHFIDDFELQLAKTISQFEKTSQSLKVAHPRLGFLNAKQWLRFIEIHLNHHLKQLRRIENSFL
jgi:hypothetical protein